MWRFYFKTKKYSFIKIFKFFDFLKLDSNLFAIFLSCRKRSFSSLLKNFFSLFYMYKYWILFLLKNQHTIKILTAIILWKIISDYFPSIKIITQSFVRKRIFHTFHSSFFTNFFISLKHFLKKNIFLSIQKFLNQTEP